jgi:hypothetical protein
LGGLTKLKQSGIVEDFIASFERLAFRTKGMIDAFFRECFISGLKEKIQAHVLMAQPSSWMAATKKDKEEKQVISSQKCKPSFIPCPKPVNPTTPFAPLKIQKLTRDEMDECQLKGICYNCDEKYFPGHKCKEQNIFMAISEDISEEDIETPLVPESCEITDNIKHRKVIILVDSGSNHNFIHRRIAQETHCYIHVVNNFQIMIANGGSMKCEGPDL